MGTDANTIAKCNVAPETGLLSNCTTALNSANAKTPYQIVERDGMRFFVVVFLVFRFFFAPLSPLFFSHLSHPHFFLPLLSLLPKQQQQQQQQQKTMQTQASSGGPSRPPTTPSRTRASRRPRATSRAPPSPSRASRPPPRSSPSARATASTRPPSTARSRAASTPSRRSPRPWEALLTPRSSTSARGSRRTSGARRSRPCSGSPWGPATTEERERESEGEKARWVFSFFLLELCVFFLRGRDWGVGKPEKRLLFLLEIKIKNRGVWRAKAASERERGKAKTNRVFFLRSLSLFLLSQSRPFFDFA